MFQVLLNPNPSPDPNPESEAVVLKYVLDQR